MTRHWHRALPPLLAALVLAGSGSPARAAAEVHKFSLVINAVPTSVDGGDFNRYIDDFNQYLLRVGLQTVSHVSFGWEFGGELRYFLRPNLALAAGVSQLRASTRREYLPGLTQDVVLDAEVLSAPIHAGADYYFTPYNVGDFRAQFYAGGGLLSLTSTHSRFQLTFVGADTSFADPSFKLVYAGDAPGYYVEAGVHMFFAVRYSVLLGAIFRSAEVSPVAVYYADPRNAERLVGYAARRLNVSGVGARASLGIGF